MKQDILKMFEKAYKERSPLFGTIPTRCVVELSEMLPYGARIADLGCGDGRDSLFLLNRGFAVMALDFCQNAISALLKVAMEQNLESKLEAVVDKVTNWHPQARSFDAVIGVTILDHLPLEDHDLIFEAIEMCLRPGGLIALEMHSDRDPGINGETIGVSEFIEAIQSVSVSNYLLTKFLKGWRILKYSDRLELDTDHGDPHNHGFVTLIAKKEDV